MATKTLGTNATTTLTALSFGGGPVTGSLDSGYSEADIAAISQLILNPRSAKQGVVPTGTTTTGSASVTSLSSVTGIRAGNWIFGPGIPPGTQVASVGASSLIMSAAITGVGAAGVNLLITPQGPIGAFSKLGSLYVPNRGTLQVYPGDWVGVDASGFPILVGVEAIAFANSSWTHS